MYEPGKGKRETQRISSHLHTEHRAHRICIINIDAGSVLDTLGKP